AERVNREATARPRRGAGRLGDVADGAPDARYAKTYPLGTVTRPLGRTVRPLARSSAGSTPSWVPGGTTTFLSTMALRAAACRPTSTLSESTLRSTVAYEFTRTRLNSTDSLTVLPDAITPPATSELTAWPRRPSSSCTNFAGGEYSAEVR